MRRRRGGETKKKKGFIFLCNNFLISWFFYYGWWVLCFDGQGDEWSVEGVQHFMIRNLFFFNHTRDGVKLKDSRIQGWYHPQQEMGLRGESQKSIFPIFATLNRISNSPPIFFYVLVHTFLNRQSGLGERDNNATQKRHIPPLAKLVNKKRKTCSCKKTTRIAWNGTLYGILFFLSKGTQILLPVSFQL